MPQSVTIRSLPRAFDLVKGMQAQGLAWGEGYRRLGRENQNQGLSTPLLLT